MKRLVIYFALMSAVAASGCAEVQELSISARNRSAAYSAWKGARWDYFRQGVPYRVREHIGRGFQEGYYEVAQGGTGKLPLFPPSYYWGVQFQSAAGNELVAAWFRGYQDGAMAAERDGIGGFRQIPSSYGGVGPMPGTAPSYDPNQPGPYGEPLPPPTMNELSPVPPNLYPEPTVPPALQEEVPLRTLDAPDFPAPPKPPAPMATPNLTTPAEGTPSLSNPSTIPTPTPGVPPTPSAVPKPTSPAPPKPTGSPTPTGPAPKVGSDLPYDSAPSGIDFKTTPAIERRSTVEIRPTGAPGMVPLQAAPVGAVPFQAAPVGAVPLDPSPFAREPPYAQQTLFAEPNQ